MNLRWLMWLMRLMYMRSWRCHIYVAEKTMNNANALTLLKNLLGGPGSPNPNIGGTNSPPPSPPIPTPMPLDQCKLI